MPNTKAYTVANASGGMTLLSTTALSGTSVTVSSISGSYTNLMILIKDPTTTAGNNILTFRLNGNSTASDYQTSVMRGYSSTFLTYADNTTGGFGNGWNIQNNTADNFIVINIPNYANTTTSRAINTQFAGTSDQNVLSTAFGITAFKPTGTAINSFTVASLNTLTAGSIEVWGIK